MAAKKTSAKKTSTKKTSTTKAASTGKAAEGKAAASKPARKKSVTAKKPAAKKSAAKKSTGSKTATSRARSAAVKPSRLVVLEHEDDWTKAELDEVRDQLDADVERLTAELAEVEGDLESMIQSSEGAGNDQADVGSANFERDQELTIVHNAREMLEQCERALERIADHT